MKDRGILVVKIGSNTLVDTKGHVDRGFLADMAGQIAQAQNGAWKVVIVTSGAVASGLGALGLSERPPGISTKQALAAIGQARLMTAWQEALDAHRLIAAQILLTGEDFTSRRRYLNLRAAMRSLFEQGAVPIINENDTVAVEELAVGDNDRLSALVASQLEAKLLVLLTDIDGFYDADPRVEPKAKLVPVLTGISAQDLKKAGDAGKRGRGGMRSKLLAGRIASSAGVPTIICKGREENVVTRVLAGEALGTRINPPDGSHKSSRRRWLGHARNTKGSITIDDGARRALVDQGRSLLPVGVTAVHGTFDRGDTIEIIDQTGAVLARGLAGLSAKELDQIKGHAMNAAEKILGYSLPKTAVHRDDLILDV